MYGLVYRRSDSSGQLLQPVAAGHWSAATASSGWAPPRGTPEEFLHMSSYRLQLKLLIVEH